MNNKKVRWGVAGLGKIAHRFSKDLTTHVSNGQLCAVAARNQGRADKFAKEYGCSKAYGSYQGLAKDPCVDIIYVSTIHPFHRKLVELFLSNGKHVCVEKPAFTTVQDWDEMSRLAEAKGLLLIEAMKLVTFPAYRQLSDFIKKNDVKITSVEASFGNWHEFSPHEQIFTPNLCGGATLDVGVYPLWLYVDLCHLSGVSFSSPSVKYIQDNPDSRVDETVEFNFYGEVQGKISASITRNLKREAVIMGSNFEAIIHDKWWNPKVIDITYHGVTQRFESCVKGGGFEFEIEHISSIILNGGTKSNVILHENSHDVISIMEKSLSDNGYQYLVDIRSK